MPLIVEDFLPAKDTLQQEDIFIIGKSRAKKQDIRPISLAILNLMPNKEETEIQILRCLSNTPLQVNVDLIKVSSHISKNTEASYLKKFYKDFEEIKNRKYDGMIITGAPVEQLEFEDVNYWEELEDIFEYAKNNVYSTMFICWASQAALYYYYDVPKYTSSQKIFGVYEYDLKHQTKLTNGFDDRYYSPQSRYTYVREEDVAKIDDLVILSAHDDTGVSLASSLDQRFVFVSGHSEYDRDTLYKEYLRDLEKGLSTPKPIHYFVNNDEEQGIEVKWRSSGNLFFQNWLNHYVYQSTPYDLNELTTKKVLKFGGTSLSDKLQFEKVKDIVASDEGRRLVIVSAPGKRFKGDIKITDLLIGYTYCEDDAERIDILNIIRTRYTKLIHDIHLDEAIMNRVNDVLSDIESSDNYDFILSRGEYLSGLIMSEYLQFEFLDPKDIIFFDEKGAIDKQKSYREIRRAFEDDKKYVIPGFYGTGSNGEIKIFDRGGSDITGSLIASALGANVYENWTDVDGLMDKDPNKFDDATLINNLSYEEFIKISLNGDQVYHIDAIKPVMEDSIPINIRNTNKPSEKGTIIGNRGDDFES